MTRVRTHPAPLHGFTGQPLGPDRVEYFFPVDRSKIRANAALPEEFDRLADLSPDNVQATIRQKLSTARTDGVQALGRRLSAFQPVSLLVYDRDWYLRFCRDAEDYTTLANFYARPTLDSELVQDLFDQFACHDETFRELIELFAGFGESFPPMAGAFTYDDFKIFNEEVWSEHVDEEENANWMDALCLYATDNGDILLMNDDGETGWFRHDRSRIISKYTDNFPAFLSKYISVMFDGGSI